MLDKSATIESFLDAAAGKQPTPGGGSVAALAGALAAAMGEMVLNYSVGKKGLEQHSEQQQLFLSRFHHARQMMIDLMYQDQEAYSTLSLARKKPANDPAREMSIKLASKLCIDTPRMIAMKAVDMIQMADEVVDIANQNLLSDLLVCAELAMATTRAAIYNVKVNLSDIADIGERQQIAENLDKQLSTGISLIKRVIPRIIARMSQR